MVKYESARRRRRRQEYPNAVGSGVLEGSAALYNLRAFTAHLEQSDFLRLGLSQDLHGHLFAGGLVHGLEHRPKCATAGVG
jgi:hypothetical protein